MELTVRKREKLLLSVFAALFVGAGVVQAEDWPCFRGPSRQGLSQEKGIPTEWSATSNVKWKTAIPGEGW